MWTRTIKRVIPDRQEHQYTLLDMQLINALDSSDTKDLGITSRDWKYIHHQHGSAAESRQGSNDPTRGIREEMRRLNISSDDGAPNPSTKKEKPINPYSDPELEREIFGGLTYEEFDREFRYHNQKSSDPDIKDAISSSSNYINFKAFPDSKSMNIVYLQRVDTEADFDEWVNCLIGQINIAGLGRFVPDKRNNWSSDIMDNKRLHRAITFMWKKCVPRDCCPDWVKLKPYDSKDSSDTAVFKLLSEYNKRNKNREVWRETFTIYKDDLLSSDAPSLWNQLTRVFHKTMERKTYRDADLMLDCIQHLMIETLAIKYVRIKDELIKNKDMDFQTALNLLEIEAENYVKPKRVYSSKQDQTIKPYERNKKNKTNTRSNWNRSYNSTTRSQKSGKYYNKPDVNKKRGKVNYIERRPLSDDDESSEEDAFLLRQH